MRPTSTENPEISLVVNPPLPNEELNALFAASWPHFTPRNFQPVLAHNLAHIGAFYGAILIGFVNIAWDGGLHCFLLDTTVHPDFRRRGIGKMLVQHAIDVARQEGVSWIHVDYEPQLQGFYANCGFGPTSAGLLKLE